MRGVSSCKITCTLEKDYTTNLMSELTQEQIERLSPQDYSHYLATGDIELIDDDELSEDYLKLLRQFDL